MLSITKLVVVIVLDKHTFTLQRNHAINFSLSETKWSRINALDHPRS